MQNYTTQVLAQLNPTICEYFCCKNKQKIYGHLNVRTYIFMSWCANNVKKHKHTFAPVLNVMQG